MPSPDAAEHLSALGRLDRGMGSLVLVEGAAGMGKTRFCEALMAEAIDRGVRVAWSACWEASSALPALDPWRQVLEQLGIDAAFLEVEPRTTSPSGKSRDDRTLGLVQSIRAASERQQCLIVIDDMHWADTATLRFLGART